MKRVHFVVPAGVIVEASRWPSSSTSFITTLSATTELDPAEGELHAGAEPGSLEAVHGEHTAPSVLTVARGDIDSVLRSSAHEARAELHELGIAVHIGGKPMLEGWLPLTAHELGIAVPHESGLLFVRLYTYAFKLNDGRLAFRSGRVYVAASLVDRELPPTALEIVAAGRRGEWWLRWPDEPRPQVQEASE